MTARRATPDEDREFRETTLEILSDLRAKLNMLVGPDGTNGRFADLEKRVDAVEDIHQQQQGGKTVLAVVLSSISSIVALGITLWKLFH